MIKSASPSATRFAFRCRTRALNAVMLPSLLSVVIPLGVRYDSFWANVYICPETVVSQVVFFCNFDYTAWIKLLHSIRNSNMTLSLTVFALEYVIHSGKFWSKQVNYNQVVVKCQILQERFLQSFNMQKFQNMEHSNSSTFKGLEFFCQNSRTFKDFSRTLWTLSYTSMKTKCFILGSAYSSAININHCVFWLYRQNLLD